jgi:hypothetical protein
MIERGPAETTSTSSGSSARNLALVIAGVAVALGAGYWIGQSRGSAPPAVGAAAPVPTPVPAAAPAPPAPLAPAQAAEAAPRQEPAQRTWRPGRREVGPPPPAAEPAAPSAEPTPAPQPAPPLVVPAGTRVQLRLITPVSSQSAAVGEAVEAEIDAPVAVGGRTAIPPGARLSGHVTEVHALRKIGGKAHLAFTFDTLDVGGRSLPVEAAFARTGKSETGKDTATIAAGAVVGTVLGNQSRHNDRGKLIGGLIGAGVGAAIAAATPGETIELPAGTRLELTLRGQVEVRPGD